MKNQYCSLLLITYVCLTVVISFGFASAYNYRPSFYSTLNDTLQKPKPPKAHWEKKLNSFMNGKQANLLSKKGLKLINYKVVKDIDINTKDSFFIKPITDETLMPLSIKTDSNNIKFYLVKIANMPFSAVSYYRQRRKDKIDFSGGDKFKLVKLTWRYQGKKFHSQCIVSQATQQIVYDNIITYLYRVTTFPDDNIVTTPKDIEHRRKIWRRWRNAEWKEQLNAYINGEFAQLLARQSYKGLRLLNYIEIGRIDINSKDSSLIQPIADDMLIPVYFKSNKFRIKTIRNSPFQKSKINKTRKSLIQKDNSNIILIVNLTWCNNDTSFNTQCLISTVTHKIIYDNIISYINSSIAYHTQFNNLQ